MSLAEELLEHARFIATLDPRTMSQASVRRAISAAYDAVFHLLATEVAGQVSPVVPAGLRERTQRALEHGSMAKVADAFSRAAGATVTPFLGDFPLPEPVSGELASIANSFKELQEARHSADYDVSKRFDPADALIEVQKAEKPFEDWNMERNSNNAPVFLASLMFGRLRNR